MLKKLPKLTLFSAFAQMISKNGLIIALTFFIYLLGDQILTRLIEIELTSSTGTSSIIWIYGITSFLWGFILPLLVALFLIHLWRLNDKKLSAILILQLPYLIREGLRVLGQSLSWSFLFILPGLVRFFFCLFVPYVVLLDPRYQDGQVDAIKESSIRIKKVWFQILCVFIFFTLIWPIIMTLFDHYTSFLDSPITAIPFFVIEFSAMIVFQWCVLKIWEKTYEPHVPAY